MLIMTVLAFFSYKINKNKVITLPIIISLILFSFIFGIREKVGIDHIAYTNLYTQVQAGGIIRDFEIGFSKWMEIFANNGLHYSYFFGSVAFVQLFFTFKAARYHTYLLPSICILLFLGGYALSWMNGMRQCLALCIFYYSLTYLEKNKQVTYCICILLASLFHKSVLMLLPIALYPFLSKPIFNNIKYCFFLYITFFLFGSLLAEPLWGEIGHWFILFNYDDYATDFHDADIGLHTGGSGLGIIIRFITNIIIILYSSKMRNYFKSIHYNIIFDLYFLSLLITSIFGPIVIIGRINMYFSFTSLFLFSYFWFYMTQHSKKRTNLIFFIIFISLQLSLYINSLHQGEKNYTEYHSIFEAQ